MDTTTVAGETPARPGAGSASANEAVVLAGNGHGEARSSPGMKLVVTENLGHPLPQGILARHGDLVLLCESAPGQGQRVGMLVDLLVEVALDKPCGQLLSRRLANLLSTAGSNGFPALCAFGPTTGGIAAVVHGSAELTITAGGRQLRLDGREAVTVVDRVVTEPIESMCAVLGELTDLHISGFDQPDPGNQTPVNETATGEMTFDQTAIDKPAGNATDPAPPGEQAQGLTGPTTQPNTVLPEVLDEPGAAVHRLAGDDRLPHPQGAESQIIGVHCKHNHFNDTTVAYCMVCGISMAQSEKVPVLGTRPALGVLVLDDGTTYSLERAYVFGRAPETDEMVDIGKASPVRLADPMMSRVHARVVLDGWEVSVIDADSTNGTFVCPPGQLSWTRLSPGAGATLQPGAMAAFGRRRLRYHSYRNW